MRRGPKIALAAALAVVGALGVAVAASGELRAALLFQVAPGFASRHALVRLEDAAGRRVTLVGTIHGAHLTEPAFGLWHLAAAVEHAGADLVLVESRAEELARGNTCDGPVEMGFVTLLARSRGLEVRGVDWWERQALGTVKRSDDAREEAMFQRVSEALRERRGALVLTGFSHTPELAARLRSKGFHDVALAAGEAERLLAPDAARGYPDGLAACLERRIADDEQALATEADASWRANLERNVAARRTFLATVRAAGR